MALFHSFLTDESACARRDAHFFPASPFGGSEVASDAMLMFIFCSVGFFFIYIYQLLYVCSSLVLVDFCSRVELGDELGTFNS